MSSSSPGPDPKYRELISLARRMCLTPIGASVCTMAAFFAGFWLFNSTEDLKKSFTVATYLASAIFYAALMLRRFRKDTTAIKNKVAEVRAFEALVTEEESVTDLLKRQINRSIGYEEIIMLRAESRANILYYLGLLFLILSIFCPLLSLFAYWYVEPLSASMVQYLKDLKNGLGDLPPGITISVQRDWRVLLGGISFGFLLLAAASGLLRQQAKELKVYFRTGERVNSYKRLISVLEIQVHSGNTSPTEREEKLTDLVVDSLLDCNSQADEDMSSDEESLDTKDVLGVIKSLKGL